MKTIFRTSVLLFIIVGGPVIAQAQLPTEQTIVMGKAEVNAWVVTIDDEPLETLKKGWSAYVKEALDAKTKKEGRDQLVVKEVLLPRIYAHKGDLKAKFFTEYNRSTMAVALVLGYDLALNTAEHPAAAHNLRVFVENFVKDYKTRQLTKLIARDEKREKVIERAYRKHKQEHRQRTKYIAKLDRKLGSDKTDTDKKFDLRNQRVAEVSRVAALEKIMLNQKEELTQLNQNIQRWRIDISRLERLFSGKLAEQGPNS